MSFSVFENALWKTLSGPHRQFSAGDEYARRYLPGISPFAAIKEASPIAFATLERLAEEKESLVLFSSHSLELPAHWEQGLAGELLTMVLNAPLPVYSPHSKLRLLTPADVPEMLELTALTRPGPFREETIKLGDYFGIFIDGRLAAMAGERARLESYTEISAVCTHPDFQGQGLARELVLHVAHGILSRNETPMLRVITTNAVAISVYEKLGFQEVDRLQFINFCPLPLSNATPQKELQAV
jgi:ribosomal protein S18 acetylase RimI-like enzyme